MKFNSLSIKIISVSIFIITLIMSLSGIYDTITKNIELENNLKVKIKNLPQSLAISISSHFWDYNKTAIVDIINFIMQDKEIFGIAVYEKDGGIFYETKRNAKGEMIEENLTKDDFKKELLESNKADMKKDNDVIGSVEVFLSKKIMNQVIFIEIIKIIIKIILITIIIIIFLYFVLNKILISQIKVISTRFRDIAEGEGDLSIQLEIKSQDELGYLCKDFNKFIGKMKVLIISLKNMSNENKFLGENLSSSTEEVSASINEISSIMTSMAQKIDNLSRELSKVKDAIKNVDNYMQKSVNMIEDQSASIIESSSSIEEMISNLNSITNVTESKKNLSVQLTGIAKDGEAGLKNTMAAILEITNSTEVIASMIKVINNVASQTNLLAMNAAIEAAHAGEYGKGFSVVADEIRNLAETTAENAKNISKSLKSVVGQIKNTEEISNKTNQIIYQLIEGIVEITNSMNEMLIGLKEINIGSAQITSSLNNLINITENVKSASTTLKDSSADMTKSIDVVYVLSNDNKNSIEEISIGINEIGKAIYTLSDLSTKNNTQVKSLDETVSKFKID
jgi:methyl-accepting chemotaxis protein